MRRSSHESLKNDLKDENQGRSTTHYAEHGEEESLVDLAHKPSASTSRRGSSESHGARLPPTTRDQGCSDGHASSKLLKCYKCRLASLKNDLRVENQADSCEKSFVLQRTGRQSTTQYAEHGEVESLVDLAHKPSASTSRRGSSESQGAQLPATTRNQGSSDGRASSKLLKSYKSGLASLKSETQSRADMTSSSTSAPRGDSEKTILLRAVHSDLSLQSNANDYIHMRSGANKTSRTSSMHSKHSGAYSRSHWLAQSAEDLAAPLHSVHPDKATRRRHSDEPDVQKLSRGSTSSSTEAALRSGTQRRGSSILQSVRRRGSLMSTAADSNVAVSSGSAFYASQIMARRTSKPEVARAKPRPQSTDSRQLTQSNQPEGAGIRVGTGQSLRSGLVLVFSAFASLLGLLMSVQTYVSLVMAPAKLVFACLSSQAPWSGEPSATENGRRHSYCEHAKGPIESQRRRSSTEDMWAMEALALNYDFSV